MTKIGKIKTLTIASLSAIALAVPIALAQTPATNGTDQDNTQRPHQEGRGHGKGWGQRGGRGWGEGQMHGGMFRGINLTEDQKTRMKQINQNFQERTKSLQAELRSKRQELRQASEGGTFNEALATQKFQESAGLQAKLMGERFKLRQELESVLTAEQKAQLEQKRAEFKSRWSERGERKAQ